MSDMNKLQMAQMILNEDKKAQIKDTLCSFYGVVDVSYTEYNYGIGIEIKGANNFRFIKSAIVKVLDINEDTLNVLSENSHKKTASYVYFPEKDKNLQKKLKVK